MGADRRFHCHRRQAHDLWVATMRITGVSHQRMGKFTLFFVACLASSVVRCGAETSDAFPLGDVTSNEGLEGSSVLITEDVRQNPSPNNAPETTKGNELAPEDSFVLLRDERKAHEERRPRRDRFAPLLSTFVAMGLATALFALAGLIVWDIMNFVGNVPDPFAGVKEPQEVPHIIEQMLAEGKSFAFVIR